MQQEIRRIVCEGKCNPDLADFDALCHRFAQFGDRGVGKYVVERSRELIHTDHVITQFQHYDVKIGWCVRAKCTVCGHTRKY